MNIFEVWKIHDQPLWRWTLIELCDNGDVYHQSTQPGLFTSETAAIIAASTKIAELKEARK